VALGAKGRRTVTGPIVLLRHLRIAGLVRDLVMLALVGTLGAFAMLFSARSTFDKVVFEAGLDYEWRSSAPAVADAAGALTLEQVPSVNVARLSGTPTGGSRISDFEHSVAVPALSYDPARATQVNQLFRGVLVDGAFDTRGVALDQATAHRFGLRVGDDVGLAVSTDSGLVERRYPVSALVLPYLPPMASQANGLVILPQALLEPMRAGAGTGAPVTYTGAPVPGAVAHTDAIYSAAFGVPELTAFVGAVLALGTGIWVLGNVRAVSELARNLAGCARTLFAIGVPRWKIRATVLLVALGRGALAAIFAVAVSASLITSWAGYYIQWREALSVAVVLAAVSALVVIRFSRRASRQLEETR
jgi:hypothetical protein